jgi:predicted alpha/beta hydrolase
MAPLARSATAALTVATPNGYWRQWHGRERAARFLQWHLGIPALTRLTGRLPGRALGGESLPRGVADQWAAWGRHPDFVAADPATGPLPPDQRFAGPLAAVYVPGDPYARFEMGRWLLDLYPAASGRAVLLDEQHRGLGHFGAFRPDADALWSQAWNWLSRAAATPRRPLDA